MDVSRREMFRRASVVAAGVAAGGVLLGGGTASAAPVTGLRTGLIRDHRMPKIQVSDYVTADLPEAPDNFGHFRQVKQDWQMLGNDVCGDCFYAGAAHEHMTWGNESGKTFEFDTKGVIDAYSDLTHYDPFAKVDPVTGENPTDVGTIPMDGFKHRQRVGIRDAKGKVHKLDAYASIDFHDLDLLSTVAWMFGSAGIAISVPSSAMTQFKRHQPWDVSGSSFTIGGHYVPLVGRFLDMYVVITWGRLQLVTKRFLEANLWGAYATFSKEMLTKGKSPEGFKGSELLDDVHQLTK